MSDNLQHERERLSQAELFARLTRDASATELVTVYHEDYQAQHNHGVYCALIPSARIEESLAEPTWDLAHGGGLPGANKYSGKNGEECVEYLRFGERNVEPLVIARMFHRIRPDYVELSEEFRLFHRLYHERKEDQFLKIEDDGGEILVATIEPERVQVRLKELRQFLAIKEMHLAIQFDCREYSSHTLEELGLEAGGVDHRDDLRCWGLRYGSFHGMSEDHESFSRLLGKRLIPPLPKEKSGFWGFAREDCKRFEEFTIDVDKCGDAVACTSDPDALANSFGGNRGAPHYLTAVHFSKGVLDKYYQEPAKYSVEDSIVRCGSLWHLTIDNHHDDRVCVWLGDLGRDLPHTEQLHWRSHNILPVGGVSETFYRRQIRAEFAETDRPELLFRDKLQKLQGACKLFLEWQLLLPLSDGDVHYFKGLRVPSTDGQKDFDEVVLGLTKVIIDSLNEKKLNALLPISERSGFKGSIARLEAVFVAREVEDYEHHISFLRKLQELRSSGAAHRKGRNYRKIVADFGAENQNLRGVFCAILEHAISLLEFLAEVVIRGTFGDRDAPSLPPREQPEG